ncbi:MAG: hypothetical protein RL244_175 [Pseudomonadota bacterium]|jgi:hypothetical protein
MAGSPSLSHLRQAGRLDASGLLLQPRAVMFLHFS